MTNNVLWTVLATESLIVGVTLSSSRHAFTDVFMDGHHRISSVHEGHNVGFQHNIVRRA
jgi:hypothetical protein